MSTIDNTASELGENDTVSTVHSAVAPPHPRDTAMPHGVTPSSYFDWKRVLDVSIALLLLVPALPLIGLLVLLVRFTQRGPGLFKQVRVGKDDRLFTMYKIRTMRLDAEAATGAVWAQVSDPRVTRLGRFFRATHLDELPQLFNILKGEMSLTGPRPERPEFVSVLARAISGYSDRHTVRPGITGLAQVNFPPDTDLASVRRKVALDLEYITSASMLFDLRLLACTAGQCLKLPARRWLRLDREVILTGEQPSSPDVAWPQLTTPHLRNINEPRSGVGRPSSRNEELCSQSVRKPR